MYERISVIIPVYNVEKYLYRCVESVLNQSYKNLEIILVDDGSTDRSGDICDYYEKQYDNIKVVHKTNGGLSSARNIGIEIASGEFIGFVDSDDWITTDMYEYLYNLQVRYDADVVQIEYFATSSDSNIINNDNEVINVYNEKIQILKAYLADGMKKVKSYPAWSKLYRKSCFDDIRFPVGKIYEDVVTNYEVLSHSKVYVTSNKRCYFYFMNTGSITRSKFSNRDMDYILVGEEIRDLTAYNAMLKEFGEMTYARVHFMCLCKAILYKIETDIDINSFVDNSIDVLRERFWLLFKSKMEISRKLVLVVLVLNKNMIRNLLARKV